MTFRSSISTVY